MAATGTSRPSATLLAMAAILAVLALAATPASASQLNFYSGKDCSGNFLKSCFDFACCVVPGGAASYEFHYVPGFKAFVYGGDASCSGSPNSEFNSEIGCTNLVWFKSAYLGQNPPSMLKMATDE